MKKRFENAERKAGPPCRFRSFRRCKSLENDNGTNDKKWGVQQHRAWLETKSLVCLYFAGFFFYFLHII